MTFWHSLLSLFASPPCHSYNYHTRRVTSHSSFPSGQRQRRRQRHHHRSHHVTIPPLASPSLFPRSPSSIITTAAHPDDDLTIDSHLGDDTTIHETIALARHNVLSVAAALFQLPPECLTTPPMIDPRPPSSSREEGDIRRKINHFLSQFSKMNATADGDGSDDDESRASDTGYSLPDAETKWIDDMMNATTTRRQPFPSNSKNTPMEVEHKPSTYGEVTTLGARQLFHYMNLIDDDDDDDDDDEACAFWDLGSGLGKLVVQAYLEIPHLAAVVGVELSPSRHSTARRAWGMAREEAKELRAAMVGSLSSSRRKDDATVALCNDDFFRCDVSRATHVYVASLCFTDGMMERLRDKLRREGLALRCVATLKPFPEGGWEEEVGDGEGGRRMVMSLSRREYVEMSWTKSRGVGCAVYFYTFDERK